MAASPRQGEVLRLVRNGLRNRQIADHLDMTEHTVKANVSAVLTVLGAADCSASRISPTHDVSCSTLGLKMKTRCGPRDAARTRGGPARKAGANRETLTASRRRNCSRD
jgi:hypothetical protein